MIIKMLLEYLIRYIMSFINSILKVFVGDKSKQDVKAIMPIVNEIKSFESQLEGLSHDELRAKTSHFKTLIAEARASFNKEIDDLKSESDSYRGY